MTGTSLDRLGSRVAAAATVALLIVAGCVWGGGDLHPASLEPVPVEAPVAGVRLTLWLTLSADEEAVVLVNGRQRSTFPGGRATIECGRGDAVLVVPSRSTANEVLVGATSDWRFPILPGDRFKVGSGPTRLW